MPMKPTRRLNLLLVPQLGDEPSSEGGALLIADGWLGEGGRPGSQASELVEGGYRRWRWDPAPQGRLYGNRLGGFYVRCPVCEGNLAAAASRAVVAWQDGAKPEVMCPSCESPRHLDRLDYRPPAALGFGALELRDVGAPYLLNRPDGLMAWLGADFRVIASRG